jgi:hypothetical protein
MQLESQLQLGGAPGQPLPPPPKQKPMVGSWAMAATQTPPLVQGAPPGSQTGSHTLPAQKSPATQSWEGSWRVAVMLQLAPVAAVPPS